MVQIWPGRFVCKQVTVCPGHIWTTLYLFNISAFNFMYKKVLPRKWRQQLCHIQRDNIRFKNRQLAWSSLTDFTLKIKTLYLCTMSRRVYQSIRPKIPPNNLNLTGFMFLYMKFRIFLKNKSNLQTGIQLSFAFSSLAFKIRRPG